MTIQTIKDRIPDHARDLRLNLAVLEAESELSARQRWGTALAAAIASRNAEVVAAVEASAPAELDADARRAARAAAAIMAMNNVYYRFLHMVEKEEYRTMPARLRMQVIARPGVDALDFELWSLAVSAINGCSTCVASHEKVVREKGASPAMVQDAVRIAAVIHAVAVTLEQDAADAVRHAA